MDPKDYTIACLKQQVGGCPIHLLSWSSYPVDTTGILYLFAIRWDTNLFIIVYINTSYH